jgi:glucose-1-phosphate thymidylyltransferase
MTPPIGLVPAAGSGVRFLYPTAIKELHPVPLRCGEDAAPVMRPICHAALQAVWSTGADKCVVVISPRKTELRAALGDVSDDGLLLSYVVQSVPLGLPNAIRAAAPLLGTNDVVFALPDTIHFPTDALVEIHRRRVELDADVMLGVFPTIRPCELGPVEYLETGIVTRVHDKPRNAPSENTWGIASWSTAFTAFCVRWDKQPTRAGATEPVLGHVFDDAIRAGLHVRAHFFASGAFEDIGTPTGLTRAIDLLDRRSRVVSVHR